MSFCRQIFKQSCQLSQFQAQTCNYTSVSEKRHMCKYTDKNFEPVFILFFTIMVSTMIENTDSFLKP